MPKKKQAPVPNAAERVILMWLSNGGAPIYCWRVSARGTIGTGKYARQAYRPVRYVIRLRKFDGMPMSAPDPAQPFTRGRRDKQAAAADGAQWGLPMCESIGSLKPDDAINVAESIVNRACELTGANPESVDIVEAARRSREEER